MTSWIYETPDGGKTLYRRAMGKHEMPKQIMVDKDAWFSMEQLCELGRQSCKQEVLRLEYPALKELWQEYHTMLALVSAGGK